MEALDRKKVLKSFLDHADELDARNKEGIEKYRKDDFTLKFSRSGNKKLVLRQTGHDFYFGSTAFMLGSFEVPEKETKFKEYFGHLFNQAVVPLYWKDLEPTEGHLRFSADSEHIYRRPPVDMVLNFCKESGIEPKGHCLTWAHSNPDWLEKYTPEQRKGILERRFRQISEAYGDKIPSFDVVNEAASNYNKGRKVLFEEFDEYALMLGEKYFAKNRKILNETNAAIWRDFSTEGKYMAFRMQLEEFVKKQLPFDEIGLQYHIFCKPQEIADGNRVFLDAENMIDILDTFDAYGFPMHISEITIPAYSGRIPENEALQAELTEILYKTWFATRNMKSIIWWNMVDGYAAYAPLGTEQGENQYAGGLIHFDMTPKPAYETLDRLINREWKTNIETKADGDTFTFRGFCGTYEATVEDESGKHTFTVHLGHDEKSAVL